MASLGELFIELGIFADTKELKNFEKKLEKVSKKIKETGKETQKTNENGKKFASGLIAIATAVSGAIFALSRMTDSLMSNNQAFLNLTRTSDIALDTFQKWDNVGRMFGIKNAAQQIANLNQALYKLKLTGEGSDGFLYLASMGVDIMGSDAEGIMEQLRSRIKGLDDNAAAFLLSQAGIDPTMLHLLRMTRAEFEAFNQATSKYRLTEEQAKNLQLMNAQLEAAKIKLQYLRDRALMAILPDLVRFVEVISNITEKIKNLLEWLNNGSPLSNFVKGVLKITAVVLTWIAAIGSLIKMLTILKTALLLLTAHPLIAALTAIAGGLMWLYNKSQENKTGSVGIPNTRGLDQHIDNRQYNQSSNRNQQITMNNTIHTSQTAKAVNDELYYYQNYAFGSGYAY